MVPNVSTKDPAAVAAAVQSAYLDMFPGGDPTFVPRAFDWVVTSFAGRYAGYQALDTGYHDLEHTMQGTLCMARLLHGRHAARADPPIPVRLFELGILSILLHDSGYLKILSDRQGTGAKYTTSHVQRSAAFAAQLLCDKGVPPADVVAVQNMIRCTGVDAALRDIPFQDEQERLVGHALATADFLGQMAADDYVDKLPTLYAEFAEAARHDGGQSSLISSYSGPPDLLRRTPAFWKDYVLPRLEHDFGGLHQFLNDPYPDGPNWYVRRIEANMRRIVLPPGEA
jgi:hypothetical protein